MFVLIVAASIAWGALGSAAEAQRRGTGRRSRPDAERAGFTLESLSRPGGMTADDAAQRAMEVAPDLARARARARAANAAAGQALTRLVPRVLVRGRYTRLSDVDNGTLVPSPTPEQRQRQQMLLMGVDDPEARQLWQGTLTQQQELAEFRVPVIRDNFFLRAEASYPVTDLFLSILPAYRASRDVAEARDLQMSAERATVALQGREVFYGLVRARGALAVAEASLEQAQASEKNMQALVRTGAAAGVDLRRVEAQVASAKVGVARSKAQVALARTRVRSFLNLERSENIELGEDLTSRPPSLAADLEPLIARAFEQRAELQAIRALVQARDRQARARAGQRWPSVFVAAGVDYANPNQRVFPPVAEFRTTWDVSVQVEWSPNDFAERHFAYDVARADAARARADLEALEDGIRQEVTAAYEGRVAAEASFEAATAGVAAAEESYRARSLQLAAGRAVTTDLLEADADLSRARLELLTAAIDRRLAHARLERAIGGSTAAASEAAASEAKAPSAVESSGDAGSGGAPEASSERSGEDGSGGSAAGASSER
jgi:outer membrane protein TolC